MSKYSLSENLVTPKSYFLNRRQFMGASAAFTGLAPSLAYAESKWDVDTPLTPKVDAFSYNNFYEFGTGKSDPAKHAHNLTTDPWSIEIGGLVDNPGSYAIEDIVKDVEIEERIYRFRCVEAWSMVVPWNGFELNQLLNKAGVQSDAKYVAFETLFRPEEMWNQERPSFPWPYVEGLRIDEAMHPLTMMATGMYGEDIPNQNGAPIRLVVPWKYGFKSIKSIVKITLTDTQPPTTWNQINATEYGFFSNVNPEVNHPRWSQETERPIGGGLFARRIPTLKFNGYEEHVADLYKGMDLSVFI